VPTYPDVLFITDAAINIFPDLETKRDIVQNAIDLRAVWFAPCFPCVTDTRSAIIDAERPANALFRRGVFSFVHALVHLLRSAASRPAWGR
jgi:hypothetical protein